MTLQYALLQQMLATSAITAIAGTRIYPVVLPQTTDLQASVVFWQSGLVDEPLFGSSLLPAKRFNVTAVSQAYDEAHELADAIMATLNHWNTPANGLLGGVLGVDVQNISVEDQYDLTDDSFDLGFFMVETVIAISYRT